MDPIIIRYNETFKLTHRKFKTKDEWDFVCAPKTKTSLYKPRWHLRIRHEYNQWLIHMHLWNLVVEPIEFTVIGETRKLAFNKLRTQFNDLVNLINNTSFKKK